MEDAFENVYILIHKKKISSKNDPPLLLEQITESSSLKADTILLAAQGVTGSAPSGQQFLSCRHIKWANRAAARGRLKRLTCLSAQRWV
jgi:hypothetical protein